ncbi:hypothetical protein [Nocardioides acrostichi]|uniref:Uncharacterized protein n=1 Tax=Nocardioides acrostichi TaxID=2784339 RepID=A0A930V2T0_9ACTN|nr:hypothetical protein [Nocardioides acrostichi]MBF4162752.1 hypothetical protein [Nocardioides acrostichi]
MHLRFIVVNAAVGALVALVPLLVLLLSRERHGAPGVALLGFLVLGLTLTTRASLLASVRPEDAERRRRQRRTRSRLTLVALVVGAGLVTAGVFIAWRPVAALLVTIVVLVVVGALTVALDRYADATARRYPTGQLLPGDEERLAPAAVHTALLRRARIGVVAGLCAGAAVAVLVSTHGSGIASGLLAGGAVLLVVATSVVGLGSWGLWLAAARRVSAVTDAPQADIRRILRAITLGRVSRLSREQQEVARRWAPAAETQLMLQPLAISPLLVWVLLNATSRLFDQPDTFNFVMLVLAWVLLPLAWLLLVVQWRRVRAFARSTTESSRDA